MALYEASKDPTAVSVYFWDHPEGSAPLEKFLLRLFTYGRFEDIRWVYSQFPQQSYEIISRYPDIRRGVKFWIGYWHESQAFKKSFDDFTS